MFLPHSAFGWSAVFECCISWSYSLTIVPSVCIQALQSSFVMTGTDNITNFTALYTSLFLEIKQAGQAILIRETQLSRELTTIVIDGSQEWEFASILTSDCSSILSVTKHNIIP